MEIERTCRTSYLVQSSARTPHSHPSHHQFYQAPYDSQYIYFLLHFNTDHRIVGMYGHGHVTWPLAPPTAQLMHVVLCSRQLFYIKCMSPSYCTLIIRLFWLVICTFLFQLPFCYCTQFFAICVCVRLHSYSDVKIVFVAQNELFSYPKKKKPKKWYKNSQKRLSIHK